MENIFIVIVTTQSQKLAFINLNLYLHFFTETGVFQPLWIEIKLELCSKKLSKIPYNHQQTKNVTVTNRKWKINYK